LLAGFKAVGRLWRRRRGGWEGKNDDFATLAQLEGHMQLVCRQVLAA